jgi:hypothetical protein
VRTLVPLYVSPYDDVEWAQALAALGSGDIAVINPDSGPGAGPDPAWSKRVWDLHGRNVFVAGYVHISYGGRDWRECVAEAARYRQLGYGIDTVFWDETSPTQPYGSLRGLHGFAKSLMPSGTGMSIFNLGLPHTEQTRVWSRQLPGSIWVTYEGPANNYPAMHPDRSREAHLVYDAVEAQSLAVTRAAEREGIGYVYATPDTLVNPWDSWKG